MNVILENLSAFQPYIIAAMGIIILILFIMIFVAFKSISKMEKKIRKLTRGVDNKNIEQVIETYFDKIDVSKEKVDTLEENYKVLNEQLKNCVQKTAIKRYKAFENVGSDLSFSIALLNEYNSGMIITGIYGREDSVVYAKPIDRGISRYDLSEEEDEVLNSAIGNKQSS
ncbi:DUF4446 family protein [Haloimpatiens lingqiaonensis]|uniref:DUF4446 family protein n=1 Tax=Haloimpatiens lingqiaonensis TaxID=1380675 RepID=UPI0010FD817D|nr:DUF4446 family protein [Haloimpatiens lingqiaonensis]